MDSSRRAVVEK